MLKHNDSIFATKDSKRQQRVNLDEQVQSPVHVEKVIELTNDELEHVSGGRAIGPDWIPK